MQFLLASMLLVFFLLKRTIVALEAIGLFLPESIESWILNHPYLSGTIGVIVVYFLLLQILWLLSFVLRPLWLLQVSQILSQLEQRLKQKINVDLPVRSFLLLSLFHFRPRVLDAWVRHHLAAARESFANKQTVAQRNIYVAMPVSINDQMCERFSATSFQQIFRKKIPVLIVGEGGAGKTSMACEMATRAMAGEPDERLCETHQMLPVLLEANFDSVTDDKDALIEAIRGGLQGLIGEPEPIFDELLLQLLRKRRVLVIVDSLSELDETTRQSLDPAQADFPVSALIVTSRIEENLGRATKTIIRPLQLQGSRLAEFMEGYLEQLGKRSLFNDPEYFIACGRLSEIVGDREITPLIVKVYVEQMVAAKEAGPDAQNGRRELPYNLPDLMLGYIEKLNDQVQAERQDIHKVISVAKITSWECLKQNCRPMTAKRHDVLKALGNDANAEASASLTYLEERLQLVQNADTVSDLVRFSLDPLAEYLAALYLVERCGEHEDLWRESFERVKEKRSTPEIAESIKGFLLAARDCCVEKGDEYRVPEWVKDELTRLSGLDSAALSTARLKQRVDRWVTSLKSTNAEDRRIAAQTLGQIGSKAKEGVPALITALSDQDAVVRSSAISALGLVGPPAVPALITALKDQDVAVRRSAASALGQIGSPAVPALITALADQDEEVRSTAAGALGKIGPEAEEAVPALIAALRDQDAAVRSTAAEALGKIGAEARDAAPVLIAALMDQSAVVRTAAAEALGKIEPKAAEAVPALIAALKNRDAIFRRSAASALGRIGPPAVPALIAALRDRDAAVRSSAASALGQIELEPQEAVPALAVALKDQDEEVRRPAAEALGKIGSAAVPALITALKDQDAEVRSSAVYALWQIGPEAKEAMSALITALKDQDAEVRSSAAAALGKIGPEAD